MISYQHLIENGFRIYWVNYYDYPHISLVSILISSIFWKIDSFSIKSFVSFAYFICKYFRKAFDDPYLSNKEGSYESAFKY